MAARRSLSPRGRDTPLDIAVDADSVYWASNDGDGANDSSVLV